jgi:hypothetical protein
MPSTPTTFRSDIRAQLKATGDLFVAANPSRIERFYSVRPESLSSKTPCGFVGGINEDISHTAGIRRRVATATVFLVDRMWTNDEAIDAVDDLGDLFLDYMTDRPHAISATTVVEVTGMQGVEIAEGDTASSFLPAIQVTLSALIQEGRQ